LGPGADVRRLRVAARGAARAGPTPTPGLARGADPFGHLIAQPFGVGRRQIDLITDPVEGELDRLGRFRFAVQIIDQFDDHLLRHDSQPLRNRSALVDLIRGTYPNVPNTSAPSTIIGIAFWIDVRTAFGAFMSPNSGNDHSPPGLTSGKRMVSRMPSPVIAMMSRSIPMPVPVVGGIAYSIAARNSSSCAMASSSPAAASAAWAWKLSRWMIGSTSSEYPVASSNPRM